MEILSKPMVNKTLSFGKQSPLAIPGRAWHGIAEDHGTG
jgi:hypothetical protein